VGQVSDLPFWISVYGYYAVIDQDGIVRLHPAVGSAVHDGLFATN